MPLPLGHAVIGLATIETVGKEEFCSSTPLRLLLFTAVLANLPDIDILLGLLVEGNSKLFHRGPTHSLFFALAAGFGASRMWRLWRCIPKISFGVCSLLVFSHVMADMLLTASPVSFFWPFDVYWTPGYGSWKNVVEIVLFQSYQDAGIITASLLWIFVLRHFRKRTGAVRIPVPARRRVR